MIKKTGTLFLLLAGAYAGVLILVLFLGLNKLSLDDKLATRYPEGFESKAVKIDNQLVVFLLLTIPVISIRSYIYSIKEIILPMR